MRLMPPLSLYRSSRESAMVFFAILTGAGVLVLWLNFNKNKVNIRGQLNAPRCLGKERYALRDFVFLSVHRKVLGGLEKNRSFIGSKSS